MAVLDLLLAGEAMATVVCLGELLACGSAVGDVGGVWLVGGVEPGEGRSDLCCKSWGYNVDPEVGSDT